METPNNTPGKGTKNEPVKKNEGNNPKLPNNDPDQTPEKETPEPPVANPNKDGNKTPEKNKIGYNK